ncbi:hypothetical protein GJ744_006473 [Endocarpon pusillum]|uniref:Uncharacterized protein n=1 Tax=Endocarpon pusillum TaxID=364733 RepID=A0A8H7AUN6_9EURO|nr:hypothetical protein GJ744_006473 [Endocarpon pusillum]
MTAQILNPSYSTSVDPFSRYSTLTDLNALSHAHDPMPSPQAWLASSKRRTMPALLDPPESPLDLLLPVTRRLEDSQWNKRLSLLAHRYLREFGLTREDDIIAKAWKTLELFCVGEEAEESLQVRTCSNWSTIFLHDRCVCGCKYFILANTATLLLVDEVFR